MPKIHYFANVSSIHKNKGTDMKKVILCLSTILLISPVALFPATDPAKSETKAQLEKNTPPDLVDQIDTTDVFAIPVDTSEEEEDVEEAKLEKMQKKMQSQKPASPSTLPTKP
jgi:hypothetical protein